MTQLPQQYLDLKREKMRGFKTWNVRSVLSHVDMETGYALNVCLKDAAMGFYLKETLIGRFGKDDETVTPEAHSWDGSYTSIKVEFRNVEFRVESCTSEDVPLILLVTPLSLEKEMYPSMLVLESGMLWNREGLLSRKGSTLVAQCGDKQFVTYMNAEHDAHDANIATQSPYIAARFDHPIAFTVNAQLTLDEVNERMAKARAAYQADIDAFKPYDEDYEAMMLSLNWDTTYDAAGDRLFTPVSRLWSVGHGGYIIFCWDNFFAGFMASLRDKLISYCNLIEITLSHTEQGFVPNHSDGTGMKTGDRSQPPVGSAMLMEIYRRYREMWVVEFLYPMLLKWNTWYMENRMEPDGAMCWGSTPYKAIYGNFWELHGIGQLYGGKMESGLDNSPMYDDMYVDPVTHRMNLKDVGLTGLYILDTRSLIELAKLLGKDDDVALLTARLRKAEAGMAGLWDDDFGFFCNKRTDTDTFEHRLSPTCFYALFSSQVTSEQKKRIAEHYYNPEEFYGDWMLPAIARNDPAFNDQQYWRGRCWAPMNFLVYLALQRHPDLEAMRLDLVEKSESLLMKEWREHRHVHENYNSITGEGCDSRSSDKFYHWGALLGVIHMAENGVIPGFGMPL